MLFTHAPQKSLEAAADSSLAMYGLQLQRAEKTTVNGMPAIVTLSNQQVQDQQTGATATNKVLSYFIEYGNNRFAFHSISSEADFSAYAGIMEGSMKTFARLTDQSRINVMPKRIRIKKAPRAGTLATTLQYYNMPQDMLEEIALLNNMELNDQIPAGKSIKTVAY